PRRPGPRRKASVDDAAAEADGYGMRARAGLKLREEVAYVRLHRLLAQEESLADLAVDEAVGDELEHLDLAVRGLLLVRSSGCGRKRDDLAAATAPLRGLLLEAARVPDVTAQDLLTLGGVHDRDIGLVEGRL